MHQYRCSKSAGTAPTASDIPQVVQPTLATRGRSHPTWFKVGRSVLDETTPSQQESTVESEYRKYASGEVSDKETNILSFWEVQLF